MGNCISKKSDAQKKSSTHSTSNISACKFHCYKQPSKNTNCLMNIRSIYFNLFYVEEFDILLNNNDNQIIQYSSCISRTINDRFLLTYKSSTLSSIQYQTFELSNIIDENSFVHSNTLMINEECSTIGNLFSKTNEINNNENILILTHETQSGKSKQLI